MKNTIISIVKPVTLLSLIFLLILTVLGQNKQQITETQKSLFWLVPLFEILQTAGLATIAFQKNRAKTWAIVMIISLIVSLLIFLLISAGQQPQSALGALISLVFGIATYAYMISKIASCISFSLLPESLTVRLLSVFGIGSSLAALYYLLYSATDYGRYGIMCGAVVVFIGGLIALFKGTKSGKEDLHGSARFAAKKDLKEFEKEPEAGAFILAPVDPKGHHGKISLPRSLSAMHGLILGGSGTGKTRGYFMPNCAEVKDTSIVVTDPKSELWKYTSGFHQKALRFAPSEPDSSQCFNWIPLCTDARMAELCARALMTAGTTQTTDQFWIDSETAFLSAIFAHTATTQYPTPLTAYRLFTRPG